MSARAIIFGCEGPRLSPDEIAFYREAAPWGFILFARNIETPDQVRALTAEMRAAVGRDAPVLVDQEGGRVQRFRPPHWLKFPPALADAALGEEAMELRYRLIAHELAAVGVDVNCAPLLDTPIEGAHDVIGDRALARDPARVAALGWAVRRGLTAGGVLPVIKHMPGHGRSMVDTHDHLPRVTVPRADLTRDFAPFIAHNDAILGMTCHLIFEALDPENCATYSETVIRLMREEIGFDGLLLTDDLSMNALEGAIGERAARAHKAGCEIILHCNGEMDEMEAVAGAVPRLSGRALERATRVDQTPRAAEPFDAAAGLARYRELSEGCAHA